MSLFKSQSISSVLKQKSKKEKVKTSDSPIHRSKSSPISRSKSGSLIKNQYMVVSLGYGKGRKEFVINIDGKVAKLVIKQNKQNSLDYDPYDVNLVQKVLSGESKEFKIEWVFLDI